jgi:hypothetical protein
MAVFEPRRIFRRATFQKRASSRSWKVIMKRVLLLGAALSLMGGIALADQMPTTGAGSPPKATEQLPADQVARADSDDWQMHQHWDRWDGDHDNAGPMHGPWHGRGHGFPMAFRGPHVILEHGPNKLIVNCNENDSTRDCVDAVKGLLAEIGKTFGHGPHGFHQGAGPDGDRSPSDGGSDNPEPSSP